MQKTNKKIGEDQVCELMRLSCIERNVLLTTPSSLVLMFLSINLFPVMKSHESILRGEGKISYLKMCSSVFDSLEPRSTKRPKSKPIQYCVH